MRMKLKIIDDIRAIRTNDPSAKNIVEIVLAYPTLHAIMLHRLAHFFTCKIAGSNFTANNFHLGTVLERD